MSMPIRDTGTSPHNTHVLAVQQQDHCHHGIRMAERTAQEMLAAVNDAIIAM
jgi:hypothetical protein